MSIPILFGQAPAADLSQSAGWMLDIVKWAVTQFQQKNFVPGCSGLLMVLIALFQKFEMTKVNKKAVPLVSAGLGVLGACAMNLTTMAVGAKPHDWLTAIVMGLTIGGGAIGFWELVGQKLLGKFLGNDTATVVADEAVKLATPSVPPPAPK
jgi:hypothetical protein